MVRCVLVDDEPPAIELLENYVKKIDSLQIIDCCYSAIEAFEIIKNETIDLLFLDIEMPVLKGLDFLKTLKNPPKVIITTAYRSYAVEGYDLDIVDYLLKPISFERFVKAIDRYYERTQSTFESQLADDTDKRFFYVNVNKKQIKIVFDEILYIESLKDYVRIHMVSKKIVVKCNIGKMSEQLPEHLFLRTHRSYIIALEKITAFTQKDVEIGSFEIPIGSSYLKEVSKRLKFS